MQSSWLRSRTQKIHNENISMSYNALSIAAELGINKVVMASSVNAIGMGELTSAAELV
jgi:hypothetical protein